MKPKNELIAELQQNGYSYEFVFENLTKIQKKKLIEFLLVEKKLSNDNFFKISDDTFNDVAILIYDDKKNIVALGALTLTKVNSIDLTFFEFSYYVGKKYRLKGIKPAIIHKISYSLSYYESYDYIIQNDIKDIFGLVLRFTNKKIINNYYKRKCLVDDDYGYATYIGNSSYISYYKNARL
jgi:hypothetical protein